LKIVVLVKQVPDPNAVRLDARTGEIPSSTPQVPNEYDLAALEGALRLAESNAGVEVVVVGAGAGKETLNRCLAMGADRAVAIDLGGAHPGTFGTAEVLAAALRAEGYDLVMAGQESSNSGTGNVGPQLGALLDVPVVSNVVGLQYDGTTLQLTREIEDGHQVVRVQPPALLCALSGLNEPRYPSLKGVMAARKKPTETKTLADLGIGADSLTPEVSWGGLFVEQETARGIIVERQDAQSAAEQLVAFLQERKLI
jgi:electron transfer flavoprotein beta subunit